MSAEDRQKLLGYEMELIEQMVSDLNECSKRSRSRILSFLNDFYSDETKAYDWFQD